MVMKQKIEETPEAEFDRIVDWIAYHCGLIMTDDLMTLRFSACPGEDIALRDGCVEFHVTFKAPGVVDVWDQLTTIDRDGKEISCGNRCGARNYYASVMARMLRQHTVKTFKRG